ncbi:MAG: hypothetical protein VYE16_06430, partial [Cyanobacteriota bacterium]|nr:hypothetical protein [Cyanobacteriota bacterium]
APTPTDAISLLEQASAELITAWPEATNAKSSPKLRSIRYQAISNNPANITNESPSSTQQLIILLRSMACSSC